MQASDAVKAFIKRRESFTLVPHWDPIGQVWDIGYGHVLGKDKPPAGTSITPAERDALFDSDIYAREHAIEEALTVPISPGIFDACVSLSYNIGIGAFLTSTLLLRLNQGDYAGACTEFVWWNKSNGEDVDGLLLRRAKEMRMFLRADYLP